MNPVSTLNYRIVPAPNNNDVCGICASLLKDYPFGDKTVSSDRVIVAHEEGGTLHPLHRFCIRDWTRRLNQANCPTCALETNIVALATLKTRTEKFWGSWAVLKGELPEVKYYQATVLALLAALCGKNLLMPQYPIVLSAVAKTLQLDKWLGQHCLENSKEALTCALVALSSFGGAIGGHFVNMDSNGRMVAVNVGIGALFCAMLLEADRCETMGASTTGGYLAAGTLGGYVGLAALSMYGMAKGIKQIHWAELAGRVKDVGTFVREGGAQSVIVILGLLGVLAYGGAIALELSSRAQLGVANTLCLYLICSGFLLLGGTFLGFLYHLLSFDPRRS